MNLTRLFKAGAVAGIAAVSIGMLSACSTHFTDPAMVSLRYEGGLTEGGKFVECVEPGKKQVTNDTYYPYPTTQREDIWDSRHFEQGSNSADQGDLQVIDKDGNIANLKVKVVFSLNTDCDVLKQFHEKIGRTRKAYFNDDGTYGSGWLWAMNNYISSAVEDKAKAAAIKYTVEEMWLDPAVRDSMAASIEEVIQEAVDAGTEGDEQFYKIGSVRIFGAQPSDEFIGLYQERKAAQVKAETAEANKNAQITEAKAKTEVAKEEALARKAEIAGFGSASDYLKYLMIQKGLNPYQPSYGGVVAPVDK